MGRCVMLLQLLHRMNHRGVWRQFTLLGSHLINTHWAPMFKAPRGAQGATKGGQPEGPGRDVTELSGPWEMANPSVKQQAEKGKDGQKRWARERLCRRPRRADPEAEQTLEKRAAGQGRSCPKMGAGHRAGIQPREAWPTWVVGVALQGRNDPECHTPDTCLYSGVRHWWFLRRNNMMVSTFQKGDSGSSVGGTENKEHSGGGLSKALPHKE